MGVFLSESVCLGRERFAGRLHLSHQHCLMRGIGQLQFLDAAPVPVFVLCCFSSPLSARVLLRPARRHRRHGLHRSSTSYITWRD